MIFNLKDVIFVAVGDTGPAPTPPPSAPRRVGIPPRQWAKVPVPPSPKRAKNDTYLGSLLYQIAAEVGKSDYLRDQPRGIYYRPQNLYGEVTAKLGPPEGVRYTLRVVLFYDGTYGAEVQRWSAGQPAIERTATPSVVEATFASASLPDALAWR